MTLVFVLHVIALMYVQCSHLRLEKLTLLRRSQTFSTISALDIARSMRLLPSMHSFTETFVIDTIFLGISLIYSGDVVVRFIGLGFMSFKADGWNLFDVFVAGGSLLTTFIVRGGTQGYAVTQLQKLFLVGIALKLVQRTNNLNKLFKTAVFVPPSFYPSLLLTLQLVRV